LPPGPFILWLLNYHHHQKKSTRSLSLPGNVSKMFFQRGFSPRPIHPLDSQGLAETPVLLLLLDPCRPPLAAFSFLTFLPPAPLLRWTPLFSREGLFFAFCLPPSFTRSQQKNSSLTPTRCPSIPSYRVAGHSDPPPPFFLVVEDINVSGSHSRRGQRPFFRIKPFSSPLSRPDSSRLCSVITPTSFPCKAVTRAYPPLPPCLNREAHWIVCQFFFFCHPLTFIFFCFSTFFWQSDASCVPPCASC